MHIIDPFKSGYGIPPRAAFVTAGQTIGLDFIAKGGGSPGERENVIENHGLCPHHLPFLSIIARAFSVKTIRWALCLALFTMTTGSLTRLASAMIL